MTGSIKGKAADRAAFQAVGVAGVPSLANSGQGFRADPHFMAGLAANGPGRTAASPCLAGVTAAVVGVVVGALTVVDTRVRVVVS